MSFRSLETQYRIFESSDGIEEALEAFGEFVMKPDGLTGGKGVKASGDHLHSVAEGRDCAFSIKGRELSASLVRSSMGGSSVFRRSPTVRASFIALVQDHKRSDIGDQGPNTGGMGSYSMADFSLPFLEDTDVREAQTINEKVIPGVA